MATSFAHTSSPALEQVLSHLKRVRTSERGWKACCPAHPDRRPSLSIGLGDQGQVLLKCFAGCSLERIVEALGLTVTDLFPNETSISAEQASLPTKTRHAPLTLVDLALEKQLPWKFLFSLGVLEHPSGGLQIPYHLEDGSLAPRHRFRTALFAKEGSHWSTGKGAIVPYGLDRLEEARKAGYLVLVEGESDCWTLWYRGFPALGLPGAEMTRIFEHTMLAGIPRLYIVQEPDAGGASFVKQIAHKLEAWQWQGKAFVLRLPDAKDPNELYRQDRQGFRAAFQKALDHAEPLLAPSSQTADSPSQPSQPSIFSLPDLLSWQLPPVRWTIPDILPEGLTLLAGKPKLGKSWLALAIALSIAAGGVALGTQPVTKGDVLYLALEDNARRLQSRAKRLLASMSETPRNLDFTLDWPRLGEGGLVSLENYCKTHPDLRLVVIDTWARVAPPSGERRCSQYEGDYEALMPLKRLADTYHVSILAIHHLRKTASNDVLDEIIGSTGLTGAVDGTMILKRDRGQNEATLFVTGRDVEQEQQLALNFDTTHAQWTLVGNADELRCTQARQEILDLLREQNPDGMSVREITEALQKNYHTTRSLLRKMEEAGEVRRSNGHYIATAIDASSAQRRLPTGFDQQNQYEQQHSKSCEAVEESACQANNDQRDDDDYSDYSDYADDTFGISQDSHTEGIDRFEILSTYQEQVSTGMREAITQPQEENQPQEVPVINCQRCNQRNHCNQCNHRHQILAPIAEEQTQGVHVDPTDTALQKEQPEGLLLKERCPHHPHAQLVRFDPAGQGWCDKMDCWDCFRLMKIGEALEYPCLKNEAGRVMIDQGMACWSDFVQSQRAFLVIVATERAIAMCKTLSIEVPDLPGEAKRLVEVRQPPP